MGTVCLLMSASGPKRPLNSGDLCRGAARQSRRSRKAHFSYAKSKGADGDLTSALKTPHSYAMEFLIKGNRC
jgi:hypothetical protein